MSGLDYFSFFPSIKPLQLASEYWYRPIEPDCSPTVTLIKTVILNYAQTTGHYIALVNHNNHEFWFRSSRLHVHCSWMMRNWAITLSWKTYSSKWGYTFRYRYTHCLLNVSSVILSSTSSVYMTKNVNFRMTTWTALVTLKWLARYKRTIHPLSLQLLCWWLQSDLSIW